MGWINYTAIVLAMIYAAAIALAVRDHFIPRPEYVPKPPRSKNRWMLISLILLSPAIILGVGVKDAARLRRLIHRKFGFRVSVTLDSGADLRVRLGPDQYVLADVDELKPLVDAANNAQSLYVACADADL